MLNIPTIVGEGEERVVYMSEICLDCWNKTNNRNDNPKKFIISKELDLCEECGEYKHVIISYRKPFYIRIFLFPFKILYILITLLKLFFQNLSFKRRYKNQ